MTWIQPTTGVHVHYVSHGSPILEDGTRQAYSKRCRHAAVTEVVRTDPEEGAHSTVSLIVMNPTGIFFQRSAEQDESDNPAGGTWHWRCGDRKL